MKSVPKFQVRSYGKGELASLYVPDINPNSATKVLRNWIEKYPGLSDKLAEAGHASTDKRFTPQQVQIIIGCLGEP